VLIGGFFGVFGAIDGFNNAYSKDHAVNRTTEYLVIIFIVPLIMVLIWGFYKLLYGSLLSKLNKNYKELMKIDL
jgi:vacuolar-type H+-ATPase subunit I/STV1